MGDFRELQDRGLTRRSRGLGFSIVEIAEEVRRDTLFLLWIQRSAFVTHRIYFLSISGAFGILYRRNRRTDREIRYIYWELSTFGLWKYFEILLSSVKRKMKSTGIGVGGFRGQRNRDDIAAILVIARRHLDGGDPTAALQAVVAALRNIGGDQAVTLALRRAQQVFQHGIRASEAADELTELFAQCAIATLPPSNGPEHMAVDSTTQQLEAATDPHHRDLGGCILAESGREQVVLDASADGSSFLCHQCGGVVSNLRRDEHFAYWCSGTPRCPSLEGMGNAS